MTCEEAKASIDAYLDGELKGEQRTELERHLGECEDCRELSESHRSLSQAIRAGYGYERTPASVRRGIESRTAVRRPGGFLSGLAVGAVMALAIIGFWPKAVLPTADLVARHVASMAGQLVQVPSSDRHTVKPWFQGKLDFSPDVYDLASQGFPLIGGRLERFDGKPAAALVYKHRAHIINVFVTNGETKSGEGDQKGFHVRHFALHGLDYWVVSDVNPGDIQDFERLFQEAAKS